MKDKYSQIETEITENKKANLQLKNDLEQKNLDNDRQIDALINDIIQILDAYEKSETKVKEMGLMDDENAQKGIKRMLHPKKVALSILSKYNVVQIDLYGKLMDENTCTIVDTEPDSEKEDGLVLSVEKNGYVRGDRLVRRAEGIVVRNS